MATMSEFGLSVSSQLNTNDDWRSAYQDALFERDRTVLRQKIKQAETLIMQREHFLFFSTSDTLERQSLNRAHHSLRALWMCLGL
jgi:hypothetical protein